MGLEDKVINNSLDGVKLNLPTIIATALSMPLAAITADVTHGYLPELNGPINEFLTSGSSDLTLFLVYNITFPISYALINKKHYTINGRFNYKRCASDLIFKIASTGGITAALLYHVPRNLVQTSLMGFGLRPAYSSLIADAVITSVYIPVRNKILNIMNEPINVAMKKTREVVMNKDYGLIGRATKRLLSIGVKWIQRVPL